MTSKRTSWSSLQRLKEDRISQLPDPLICQILSHLPIKVAVKTSLLSTRWRTLWLWVPSLELSSTSFSDMNAFVSFGHRFFDSNRVSCIEKVKLDIDQNDQNDASYVTSWIDASVKRNIQHLDVRYNSKPELCEVPLSLYICKTLVYLKLFQLSFHAADLSKLTIADSVSLPSLKTMHLEVIFYPNDATFEGLISSCPVLEELTVIGLINDGFLTVFRVFSRSLKKFSITQRLCWHSFHSQVVIDAPLLGFLSIKDDLSDSFIVKNMHSDAKLKLWLEFGVVTYDESEVLSKSSITMIRDFLPGISGVKEMIISWNTFKVLSLYSKFEPLPQFRNMSRLHAKPYVPDLKLLPNFLKSCPNLKSLILVWVGDYELMCTDELNQISFAYVPECLLSSLEFVDIKSTISGEVAEMKLVRYFLENSAILKKLTLRLDQYATQNVIFKSLLKFPRRSAVCEVVVL